MKNFFLIAFAVFTSYSATAQTEVSGVVLPNNETFGEYDMLLNGAGIREKFWIDLYVGALYLSEKSSDIHTIIEEDKPLVVRLHIVSGLITSKKMIDAITEGFEKSTDGNVAPYQDKIDQFIGLFSEKINEDDVFDITFQPNVGVVSYKNGEKLGVIQGKKFKKALFGIWFSDNPADDDLKEAMLGL